MGLRVRVMPGVRVRVSSRGLRVGVGPQIARVHFGAGRSGVSTGIGPIGFYTSGGQYSSGLGSGYGKSYGLTPLQAAKVEDAQSIESDLNRLTKAHLQVWDSPTKPVAELRSVPSIDFLHKRMKKEQLRGIPFYKLGIRKQLKSVCLQQASREHQQLEAAAISEQTELQITLSENWVKLLTNDREVVRQQLTWAFGDNEARSAVLDVQGARATVLVVTPQISVLPEQDWSYTKAGNLSVKKMTVKERNNYYFNLIFSQLVATLKEGFAVCPGIEEITLILANLDQHEDNSRCELLCIGAGTAFRKKLQKVSYGLEPFDILKQSVEYWRINMDAKLKMKPLDLSLEPDIERLLGEISKS